jgi:hypothetical protein
MVSTRDVLTVSKPPLGAVGFRKRAGRVFTVDLVSEIEVVGWLGLNCASKHLGDAVEVNPVVGVRNQPVERLVAELRGMKFHAYQPPTVSVSLGYLMPEGRYRGWVFELEEMEQVASAMAGAIAEYGRSYMQETTSLDSLLLQISKRRGHFLEYRRPVVLSLLGRHSEALSDVERTVADLGDRQDDAAQNLRSFGAAFRDAAPLALP